jgi:hypothetical protein
MNVPRIRKTVARCALAGLVGVSGLAAAGARADAVVFDGPHTLTIDPDHGPAGTRILVKSDNGCVQPESATDWQVTVWIERDGALLDHTVVVPDAANHYQWSASLTVPAGTTAGVVTVDANCWGTGARDKDVPYDGRLFKVEPLPAPQPTGNPNPHPNPDPKPEPQPTPKPKAKPANPKLTG